METGVTTAVEDALCQPGQDEARASTGNQSQASSQSSESAAGYGSEEIKSAATTTVNNEEMDVVDNHFFFEDEIFRIDRKGRVRFGLIIETPDTYSGDEEDFDEVLRKGEVRVAWYPEGREEVQLEKALALADRTLVPGDVVRRMVAGSDTQRGYCREIHMSADVRIMGTKDVIRNVTAERLRLVSPWQRDSAVCLDSWVGSTKDIEDKAVLRSAYGCRVEISSTEFYAFKDFATRFSSRSNNAQIFYPGNVVVGRLPMLQHVKLLTPNIPVNTNKKGKPVMEKYTIETVFTDAVWVNWQCKALSEEANIESGKLQQPSPCVTGDDLKRLKRLNLFESCMLQINDCSYLKYSHCDTLTRKSDWLKEQATRFKDVMGEEMMGNAQVRYVPGPVGSSHHCQFHYDKLKKKLSLHDTDKLPKAKKFGLKANSSTAKDKAPLGQGIDNASAAVAATVAETLSADASKNSSTTITDAGWVTVEEDEVDKDDDDEDDDVEEVLLWSEIGTQQNEEDCSTSSTISTCSTPSPRSTPKHIGRRMLKKKMTVTNWKKPFYSGSSYALSPKEGDEMVTEALLVYSKATVVWQDGSIEENIPSTHLYPIHHLDNHEFFPGDFVSLIQEESDVSFRDYGVIQVVDHQGRTARVKWFTTYTSVDEPRPSFKCEMEMSVYDLKDHPDFQYRPGTMVIRVANFVGEDASCTAGQIIDNFIDGRVKVWWVDGHISMCWPQDLFEVGQYDHTDWGPESEEDSWETASENSDQGGSNQHKNSVEETHILANIERARVAIARLEEIFNINPTLQNPDVMRKLLGVYKGCRYLDRLLNTNFFHEDNFMGLIERVRKGGNQSISERAQDRKNRLFNNTLPSTPNVKAANYPGHDQMQPQCTYQAIVAVNSSQKNGAAAASCAGVTTTTRDYAPKVLFNISSTSFKCPHITPTSSIVGATSTSSGNSNALKRKSSPLEAESATEQSASDNSEKDAPLTVKKATSEFMKKCSTPKISTPPSPQPDADALLAFNSYNTEKNLLLNSVMLNIERAYEKTGLLTSSTTTFSSQNDSGNYSRGDNYNVSLMSNCSSTDLTNAGPHSSLLKVSDDAKSMSCSSIALIEDAAPELVCVRLCGLLREQLVRSINEIREKYYKDDKMGLTDFVECVDDEPEAESEGEDESKADAATGDAKEMQDVGVNTDMEEGGMLIDSTATLPKMETVIEPPPLPVQDVPAECFQVLSQAPTTHKFHLTIFHPTHAQQYYRAVQREYRMLKSALPPGVWVRVFEDRVDLLSVMMEGPKNTPYEDGLFFFDIQLPRDYPKSPPLCHYISYCSDRLNPNLYEDGKVCVSLLGTWSGRESEVWGPKSTLLQVLVSIQGLILVAEPYFNEAGYEKQKGTQQGRENSRMYNEMAIIKLVQAMTKLIQQSPAMFDIEIAAHFKKQGLAMYERIRGWMEISKQHNQKPTSAADTPTTVDAIFSPYAPPDFPLVPASRGFCLTLNGLLESFKANCEILASKA